MTLCVNKGALGAWKSTHIICTTVMPDIAVIVDIYDANVVSLNISSLCTATAAISLLTLIFQEISSSQTCANLMEVCLVVTISINNQCCIQHF